MSQTVLCYSVPPLLQDAADAALDMIHFIATAVRGYDAIEVNDVVRPLWRAHLAAWFPQLPFETRNWYANAPSMLAAIGAQWQMLNPWQQAALLQQWTMELPGMLWMLEPVLEQAYALEAPARVKAAIAGLRQVAASLPVAPTIAQDLLIQNPALPDQAPQGQIMQNQAIQNQVIQNQAIQGATTQNQAIQELGRRSDMAAQLASFSTRMNSLTLTQMHAMSGT
jgi:hypothetical protein